MSFSQIFFEYCKNNEKGLFSFLDSEEVFSLSEDYSQSQTQRPDLFRLQSLSRHLANFIIDDDGDLILDKVDFCLEKGAFCKVFLLEKNVDDSFFVEGILKVLEFITTNKTFIKKIKKISLPLVNKKTEKLVRQTLMLSWDEKITNAHIRRAIVLALLSPLRQTVGSCFATSLAILIQREDLLQLFLDLEELVKTGMLKRVVLGKVYQVPQNPSMGMGELRKVLTPRQFTELYKSPSIQFAFDRVNYYFHSKELPLFFSIDNMPIEKRKKIQDYIAAILEQNKARNLYELLEEILKKHLSLKEEDFIAKKRLEKTEFFIANQMHAQRLSAPSKKNTLIDEYFEAKEILLSVFQSFVDSSLLKSWEYTLASFCDVKREYTLWNLFSSLGFGHEDKEGLGGFLYQEIGEKLERVNQEIVALHQQGVFLEGKVRGNEAILYRTDIPTEETRLRSEINSGIQNLQMIMDQKNQKENQALAYQDLYSHMIKSYMEIFEDYFQEVYDPEMVDYPSFDYNDSPAGFRLLYTHGRKETSQWTPIKNEEEFIRVLRDFFMVSENRVISAFPHYDMHQEISLLTTELIQYIQSPSFISSCLKRVQITHKQVLGQVPESFKELIIQKPWGYISGGTLDTLVEVYFKREALEKEEKEIETPLELFVWFVDILKKQESAPEAFLIAYNGGHAFLLCPYFSSFQNIWQKEEASESLLHTHYEVPSRTFISQMRLTEAMQLDLISEYIKTPEQKKSILSSFHPKGEASVSEFFYYVVEITSVNPHSFTAFLYSALLLPQSPSAILDIFDQLPFDSLSRRKKAKSLFAKRPLNALSLQKEIKKCIIQAYESVCLPYDYHKEILSVLNMQNKIYPRPILFADTNWPCYFFGFIFHPITLELDLWRFDTIGFEGFPLDQNTAQFGSKWGVVFEKFLKSE